MKKAIEYLQKTQLVVGAICLAIFLVTVVYQMGARYLHIAATWTEDVSMYAFIWAVFMGAGAMVYEQRHFAFTSLSDNIKNWKVKEILGIIICLIMLSFSVLMIYYGIQITKQFWNYTWVNIPSFKRGPTWLCLPICGITSSIYLVNHITLGVRRIVKGGDQ